MTRPALRVALFFVAFSVGSAGNAAADPRTSTPQERHAATETGRPGTAEPRVVVRRPDLAESAVGMVFFAFDSSQLTPESQRTLDRVAAWLRRHPERHLLIEGHTDPIGTSAYNAGLGTRRAEAVRRYLVARGADPDNLAIKTYGEGRPVSVRHLYDRRAMMRPLVPTRPLPEKPAEKIGEIAPPAPPPPGTAPPIVPEPEEPVQPPPPRPFYVSLGIGGGVANFFDSTSRQLTGVAGSWDVRMAFGPRSLFSVEGAYFGTAQQIDALGLDTSAFLVSSGFEADARFNFTTDAAWQPYAFGGAGYTRYDVTNVDVNNSDVDEVENLFHIPLGAGIGYRYTPDIRFDFRVTFRPVFGDDLLESGAGSSAKLSTWNAGASVAREF